MIRYAFKSEPLTFKNASKADAQKIGEALEKVSGEDGLKPHTVLDAAKNPRSPLHKHFEWDDAKAAGAYRLDQARVLIRSIRVIDDDGDEKPAYLSVKAADGVQYRPIGKVMTSRDLQLAVLRQANRDLEAWEARYRDLEDICRVVRSARDTLSTRLREAENRASA